MTIKQRKLWAEGKDLWYEYIRVNGYSKTFNNEGLQRLSRLLNLKESYI